MNFFQILKFGLEIFKILQKCCCNTKFRQEIASYFFSYRFLSCYSINLRNISPIYKSFEQITAPLISISPESPVN